MPVWKVAPVTERPEVTLTGWAVFDVPDEDSTAEPTRHLVGWSCEDREGRVSSPVMTFDARTASFSTRSGRIYRLSGQPGLGSDAVYVWQFWLHMIGDLQQIGRAHV